MIFPGSRYAGIAVVSIVDADGVRHDAIAQRIVPEIAAGYRHVFAAGDRLDLLAFRYYGDPLRFWRIADANAALDPSELEEPGRPIAVPPETP